MEVVKSFSSDLGFSKRKMDSSLAGAVVFETLLAAQISLACLVTMTGLLFQDTHILANLIGNDQRFPFDELHKKNMTELEAKDGSDTEEDDEDGNDAEEPDDDVVDKDFSGEEGGEDDEEGDAEEDPEANGNAGSNDDEDDDDDDDEDDDEDGDEDDEDEDDDDDDDEEEEQPPAKKRK